MSIVWRKTAEFHLKSGFLIINKDYNFVKMSLWDGYCVFFVIKEENPVKTSFLSERTRRGAGVYIFLKIHSPT